VNPEAEACIKKPVVKTPGVVTILFTLSQIPKDSAGLIVSNAVKYASPVERPKILFLKDTWTNGEDEGDPQFIKDELLAGYDVEYAEIPVGGLDLSRTQGKDVVIVSNPGFPLSQQKTRDTLQLFPGGVILIGDDMGAGTNFSMTPLTGLTFVRNGTSVSCDGKSYAYDNLKGYFYQVSMDPKFLPGIQASFLNYQYGNDIDHTTAGAGLEVLATAEAAPGTCNIGKIPVVVRKSK
jgi:hypothetical protein